jgi:hypothetical protein
MVSVRFTDPRLAISIPETIPMPILHSIRSLEFSFFLKFIINHKESPEDSNLKSKLEMHIPSLPRLNKMDGWKSLWSTLASARNLRKVSLRIYERQNEVLSFHNNRKSSFLPELPFTKSQSILEPLLLFQKSNGPEVLIDLCWRPDDALLESLETAGIKVMLNGKCHSDGGQV